MGIVGMGLMGHGIAQVAASNGFKVVAIDVNETSLKKGVSAIESSVSKLAKKMVEKGKLDQAGAENLVKTTRDAITPSTSIESLANCDLVIEAIVENMSVKVPFYQNIGKIVKNSAIFATNTSSLSVSEMGDASGRPDRMVGLHFFNPVQLMQLVEVVRGRDTSDNSMDIAMRFSQALGKTAVACTDTPGFIVNRLLVPYLAQAMALVDRGVATAEDVDTAMRLGAGHPMGPIHLADYVGLDTSLSILQGWVKSNPELAAEIAIPKSLVEHVKAGHLGRKTGQGYYKWDGDKKL